MNLSDRIRTARKKAGLTQAELAEVVGIAQTAISQLESGKTLRSSYLIQIARACSVNSSWLATGEGEMHSPEDMKNLGRALIGEIFYDEHEDDTRLNQALRDRIEFLRAASKIAPSDSDFSTDIPYLIELDDPSDSTRTVIEVSAVSSLMLNNEALSKQRVLPEKAVAVAISGNSMSPVLNDGGSVVANMDEKLVVDGKIYAINHGGQLRVKTLYRLPGGGLRIRSFNTSEHPDETYSAAEVEQLKLEIIGRVFWGASFF
jgi:phage repressor protein C with HTH and peptisase S24 domain